MPPAPKQHTRTQRPEAHKPIRAHKAKESRASSSARGYNRKWEAFRKAFLYRNPLCEYCSTPERIVPATVCDHDLPHEHDPHLFWNNTYTALCASCHNSTKQRLELKYEGIALLRAIEGVKSGATRRWGYSIPDGVKPSGIPVILVSGPPAAGKSTYIEANAQPGDTVIDFDIYRQRIGNAKWDTRQDIIRQAFKMRDDDIKALNGKSDGVCYLIVTAPTEAERSAWVRALGNVTIHILRTPESVCIERIKADPRRADAAPRQIKAVKDWWAAQKPATAGVGQSLG